MGAVRWPLLPLSGGFWQDMVCLTGCLQLYFIVKNHRLGASVTMLNIFLICFVAVIWPSIYYIYFKSDLKPWLHNKLTRDKLPKPTAEEFKEAYPFERDEITPPKE
ncbi:hypothetical protein AA106555_0773 [Neokomagataea thailandica NBRC 106555]|nr:hypothetical protein AA106555_0773 [Neokomagataea thailandica NBRC 106555]